jgi:hypothetical protein
MSSKLFANQREVNLASTLVLVEKALAELGHPAPASRITLPGALHAWQLAKGSAVTRIALHARPDFTHLRVQAVILTLTAAVDRGALFADLLARNTGLCGAAFALDGDRVILCAERSTLDLDESELLDVVRRLTIYADEHDDALVAQFGGVLGEA